MFGSESAKLSGGTCHKSQCFWSLEVAKHAVSPSLHSIIIHLSLSVSPCVSLPLSLPYAAVKVLHSAKEAEQQTMLIMPELVDLRAKHVETGHSNLEK